MDKIRSTVTKILATWVGIGATLITLGSLGLLPIPELLINIFSQEVADIVGSTVDVILTAAGAVIAAAQAIRAILVAPELQGGGEVSVRSLEDVKVFRKSVFSVW